MEIKTKYCISRWSSWSMCEWPKCDDGKYVLSESPNNKDESIYFEANSIDEIVSELPYLGISIDDVSVCTVRALSDWMKEREFSFTVQP